MLSLRTTLSTFTLAALVGAGLLVPITASAAPSDHLTRVVDATTRFTSPTSGTIGISYACPSALPDGPSSAPIDVELIQDPQADYAIADGNATATCDGAEHVADVHLRVYVNAFANGPAAAEVHLLDDMLKTDVEVTGVPVPAPPLAAVELTVNASPEPARKGKKITVKGSVEAGGTSASKATAILEFSPDGGDYSRVKAVRSDTKGRLKTTVKASTSGTFRYRAEGTRTTEPGASPGDHVEVIPVAKKYKNCTALTKVYPSGVGEPGATDKGGSVDDFTVDKPTYVKNKKSDRDHDGIACER